MSAFNFGRSGSADGRDARSFAVRGPSLGADGSGASSCGLANGPARVPVATAGRHPHLALFALATLLLAGFFAFAFAFAATATTAQAAACPNEAFRTGSAANLPDCRAYEMVSPIEKYGGDIDTAAEQAGIGSLFSSAYRQASIHGGKITYSAATAFGDAPGGHWSNQYIATRGTEGWSTKAISSRRGRTVQEPQSFVPPEVRWSTYGFFQGFTPDLSTAWIRDDNVEPLAPGALEGGPNERQRVSLSSSAEAVAGGTFTLAFDPNGPAPAETTGAIPYDAPAAGDTTAGIDSVQEALEGLPSIGVGGVSVSGGPGPGAPWEVEFTGALATTNVAPMVGDPGNLENSLGEEGPAAGLDVNVTTLSEGASSRFVNLYRRDNGADGYEPITSQGPFGPGTLTILARNAQATAGGPRVTGASDDLRHQIFTANAALAPGAVQTIATIQVYDKLAAPTDAQQRLTVRTTDGSYALRMTSATGLGTRTAGSKLIKNVNTTSGTFRVGDDISGNAGIPAGATIVKVSPGALEISANATGNGATALTATQTTAAIDHDAPAANGAGNLEEKLEDLPSIDPGDISVSGGEGDETGSSPYVIKFAGDLGARPVLGLGVVNSSLTGGDPSSLASAAIADPGGDTHLISVLPNGQASSLPTNFAGGVGFIGMVETRDQQLKNAVSTNGSRVFWTAAETNGGPGALYVRENPGAVQSASGECDEVGKACTLLINAGPAQYWAASENGSHVLYSTGSSPNRSVFLYDVDARSATEIAAQSAAVVGVADDLSHIYLISREDKDGTGPALAGEDNLYHYHSGAYDLIGVVTPEDMEGPCQNINNASACRGSLVGYAGSATRPRPILTWTRTTPDGLGFAFVSSSKAMSEAAAGYDNTDLVSGNPAFEVFRYDAAEKQLNCVSCLPSGERPRGEYLKTPYYPLDLPLTELIFADWRAGSVIPTPEHDNYASRVLSDDGERVFFHSNQALVAKDVNGVQDVYQWQAGGSGGCEVGGADYVAQNKGCVNLISSGRHAVRSEFVDADPSGDEVYFSTDEGLDPRDNGLRDIYVAKVGGGFPLPQPSAFCEGEACQSPPPAPEFGSPSSQTFQGAGNPIVRQRARCNRNQVRRGNRCVAKRRLAKRACAKRRGKAKQRCVRNQVRRLNRAQQRQLRQQRAANSNGRAGR